MNTKTLLAILNAAAELEPVAASLVLELIHGLKGKSDAEILQEDSEVWSTIIVNAHRALQNEPKAIGPEFPPNT